jgi:glycosyltransferase involved in cell wall biosynthesis
VPIRPIPPGSTIGAGRNEAVVCIAANAAADGLAESLRSVLAHTPREVPILLCGDVDPPQALGRLEEAAGRQAGVVASTDAALAVSAPADVIMLSADCLVAEGWLDGLREAAYADSTVATATPLSSRGGLTSIGLPQPSDASSLDTAAAAVRASSLRLRPRLPAAGRHCTYVRRSAIELIGGYDSEFSQRCLAAGLAHVAADDVLVFVHDGTGGAGNAVDRDLYPRLARSVSVARRSLTGLAVLIDARVLTGPVNGSHLHVLELIAALARSGQAQVTALLPSDVSDHARAVLETLPEVKLTTAAKMAPRADIAHRPFQISSPADLNVLAQLADRLVITHQDLISYHNPSYSSSSETWEGYRELTRRALAAADRVLFFSAHARDDALAEELVEPHRASVVHIGVDHQVSSRAGKAVAPLGSERLREGAERMLCIGTDYRHKNRVFALRLVTELQRRHGWDGQLVLAGPHMRYGSSAAEEERRLGQDQRLRDAVVNVGAVSEAEKEWLFGHVSLVLYPSVHEGFGLVPFEAAEHGLPCLWAAGTSLSEILPDAAAGITPWDAADAADRALALMRDEQARAGNLEAVRDAGAALRWDIAAHRLIEVYRATCAEPATPAGAYERREGLMRGGLSEDAMRLVGPDGLLPRRLERALLALASHPRLATPVFRAIEAGYRASQGWRRD